MNKIFVTSDTHFGHTNILLYCARPFENVTQMNESLIERWNAVVTNGDIVYHLGDFAFMKAELIIPNIISRLNGRIKLIPGNHDRQMKKLSHTFEGVTAFERLSPLEKVEIEGRHFVLCHFPLEEWENQKYDFIHLHGHTHGNTGGHNAQIKSNRFDVGVDVYGCPIPIGQDMTPLLNPKGWA